MQTIIRFRKIHTCNWKS